MFWFPQSKTVIQKKVLFNLSPCIKQHSIFSVYSLHMMCHCRSLQSVMQAQLTWQHKNIRLKHAILVQLFFLLVLVIITILTVQWAILKMVVKWDMFKNATTHTQPTTAKKKKKNQDPLSLFTRSAESVTQIGEEVMQYWWGEWNPGALPHILSKTPQTRSWL